MHTFCHQPSKAKKVSLVPLLSLACVSIELHSLSAVRNHSRTWRTGSSLGPQCTMLRRLCLAGIDDFHDGVNYTRTACVIAVSKARDLFEPFLHQVGFAWLAVT